MLVVILSAALLSACASPRNALGAGSTACFKVLPQAVAGVQRVGRLVGVRQVEATRLASHRPVFTRLGDQDLCVFAFQGDYQAGDVPGANPPPPGQFALVAINPATREEVGAFVLHQLPLRFRHSV